MSSFPEFDMARISGYGFSSSLAFLAKLQSIFLTHNVLLGFSDLLNKADDIFYRIIGDNACTAIEPNDIPIERFSNYRIFYSPVFLYETENLSFVGPDEFDTY